MLFRILIKLCFGNFDENVVLGLCRCMLSCCLVISVLESLLTLLGMNCLKDVGNDPAGSSNINRETCNFFYSFRLEKWVSRAPIIDLIGNYDCTFLQNGNFTDITSITPSLYSIL